MKRANTWIDKVDGDLSDESSSSDSDSESDDQPNKKKTINDSSKDPEVATGDELGYQQQRHPLQRPMSLSVHILRIPTEVPTIIPLGGGSHPFSNKIHHAGKRKSRGIDFEDLRRHGYKGGLSVLSVPPPKEADDKQDWSWSTGKDRAISKDTEESYQERERTRAAIASGEQLTHVQTRKDKNLSFSQKEKRKRDLGQASRGKNYVEEEKRLLRESGIYSGFDS